MWIVRVALQRPYTFVVLALLILLASPVLILRTPTDIFPNIDIPVIAVAWQFTGLNPEEMEGRITTQFERVLTTTVDNIEHIESTTVNGQAMVKIFLQPNARLDTANAQVTAVSQTDPAPASARHPAAADHQLQRVDGADSPARPVRPVGVRAQRRRPQLLADPARHGAGRVHPVPVRRQAAPGHGRPGPAPAPVEGAVARPTSSPRSASRTSCCRPAPPRSASSNTTSP